MKRTALLIVMVLLTMSSAWARSQGQTTACKSNLKNIGTACEMWASDHGGRYPKSLDLLVPEYLHHIPECPRADRDSYSETYRTSRGGHFYGVCCGGNHHGNVQFPENQPGYNNVLGRCDRTSRVPMERCQSEMTRMEKFIDSVGLKEGQDPRQLWKGDNADFPGCVSGEPSSNGSGLIDYQVDF